jgi:hypothetical protein
VEVQHSKLPDFSNDELESRCPPPISEWGWARECNGNNRLETRMQWGSSLWTGGPSNLH